MGPEFGSLEYQEEDFGLGGWVRRSPWACLGGGDLLWEPSLAVIYRVEGAWQYGCQFENRLKTFTIEKNSWIGLAVVTAGQRRFCRKEQDCRAS